MKKPKLCVGGILRYVVLLGVLFMLWNFFRSYVFFLMLILAVFAPVVSVWALLSRGSGLSVEARLPENRIGRGRQIKMEIYTGNKERFIPFFSEIRFRVVNLFTEYALEDREQLWVGPGRSLAVDRDLVSHHLGRLEVQITEFTVYDWFHLCRVESDSVRSAGVIVGGGMQEPFEEDLISCVEGFPQENELKKRGTDINPDYEVREYIPGDDLKSIHWKLTAKQGRTMVRERLAAGRDKINVLLPLTGDEKENDGLMESLQGLGLLLLDKGFPIRLCWLGTGNGLLCHYLAEPGELENALEEILSASGKKDHGLARGRMEEEYPGEAYIVVRNGAYKGEYIR